MDRIDAARLFVRLTELKSFSAAARDMRIKQSTASKWIAELERQLGVTLVERTTRAVVITDAGRRFHRGAVELLAVFDETCAELSETSPTLMGRVRMSAPVAFGRLFVVPGVVPFLKKHPKVALEMVFNDRYVNLVDEGFDIAIRIGLPADTSSRGRKLFEGRRLLVASPGYVKSRGRPKTPKELRSHDCLLHGNTNASVAWRFAKGTAKEHPAPVNGRVAVNNSEAALEMARSGMGIALLADWLVITDLERGTLVRLLEEYEPPSTALYALTPPGRYTSAAVRALLEHLGTSLTSLLTPSSFASISSPSASARLAPSSKATAAWLGARTKR